MPAFVWSVGLLAAALFAPVYGSATLVDENGPRALLVAMVPALISVVVWVALWRMCTRGGRLSGYIAWTFVSVLGAFCLLGLASIGLFVAPVAGLLCWAASLAPPGPASCFSLKLSLLREAVA